MSDDVSACARCGTGCSSEGRRPGDGPTYCSSRCEALGPPVVQLEGQQAFDLEAAS